MKNSMGKISIGCPAPLSAGCLAYLGDAVFELFVRKMLLNRGSRPVNTLNKEARRFVSAEAQATLYHHIIPHLSEEEQSVMRRGRNLHSRSKSKNADTSSYRHATGLEALFGYLFLNEQHERLTEIFEICTNIDSNIDFNTGSKDVNV